MTIPVTRGIVLGKDTYAIGWVSFVVWRPRPRRCPASPQERTVDDFGPIPTHVIDALLPPLLDTWARATVAHQTDAAVEAARELDKLLRQPVSL